MHLVLMDKCNYYYGGYYMRHTHTSYGGTEKGCRGLSTPPYKLKVVRPAFSLFKPLKVHNFPMWELLWTSRGPSRKFTVQENLLSSAIGEIHIYCFDSNFNFHKVYHGEALNQKEGQTLVECQKQNYQFESLTKLYINLLQIA